MVKQTLPLPRRLDLARDLRSRSVFLFGPRQTGKTTWLRQCFPESLSFNLLRGDVFLRLSREPGRLRQELAAVNPASGPVVIDEIQKLPSLLDDVHDLIESRGFRFVLAASSPVKLRRGGVNLLGGRARTRRMFPFVSAEVPDWDLLRAINVGGIPSVYFSEEPMEDLRAYCGNYLRLEIQAEGLVRGIEPFSRFLTAAGASYAQPIVFERLASDAAVPARTVREYFQVIEDTLLGTLLPPFSPRKARRKPVSRAKLFLFRCRRRQRAGVVGADPARKPDPRSGSGTTCLLRTECVARLRSRSAAAQLLEDGRWFRGGLRRRRRGGDRSEGDRVGHIARSDGPPPASGRNTSDAPNHGLPGAGGSDRGRDSDSSRDGVPAQPMGGRTPHPWQIDRLILERLGGVGG